MKLTKKYPVLGSSADAEKISLTIKGATVWLVPAFIAILRAFDVSVAETDIINLINASTALIAAAMTTYGLLRKLYYQIIK